MIIDAHTHIYPEKIASRAVDSIGKFYDIPMHCDGTVDSLVTLAEESGVDKCLVCSAAVDASRVRSINDFLIASVQKYPDKLIGFGTLHADMEDPAAEVAYMMANGLKGVKLHPDMQKFALDEERTQKIYKACEGVCPILIHTGDKRYRYSNPSMIPAIARDYPDLVLICAHMGGYSEWDDPSIPLPGKNVYVDCSSSFFAMTKDEILRLFNLYGSDRIFFGSDYPMWNMKDELEILRSLNLPEADMEKILSGNLIRVLNL